jgi:pimeloyl-ACP methyl ester carboxylesterase
MSTFVLVHGAWHGAWCWERLERELATRGHKTVAIDLPVDDPNAGLAEYAAVVIGSLPTADDLVLVGHSLGASVIPLVAASRPARELVFLCPVVRSPGQTLADGAEEDADAVRHDLTTGRDFFDDESAAWQPEAAKEVFYNACDAATASWAAARLRRQYWRYWEEPNPLTAWPMGSRRAIVCTDDRLVAPAWARRVLPDRLGVAPEEMPGDHSPFLSYPSRLAGLLVRESVG